MAQSPPTRLLAPARFSSNDEPSTASAVSGLELLNRQRSCLPEVDSPSANVGIGRILCIDLSRQTVDACRHAGAGNSRKVIVRI